VGKYGLDEYNCLSEFALGKKNQAAFSEHTSVSSPQFHSEGVVPKKKKSKVNVQRPAPKTTFGAFAGLVGQGGPG